MMKVCTARLTSLFASTLGNPASATIVRTKSSRRCSISSDARYRMRYRSYGSSRTVSNDRRAAATAAATCSADARSASPIPSPENLSKTANVSGPDDHSPAIRSRARLVAT
jgi:hypothetical protein